MPQMIALGVASHLVGEDKNTDNTNTYLLKLNPSLLCKPPTSILATLSYGDVNPKHSNNIKPASLATLLYANMMQEHNQNNIIIFKAAKITGETKYNKIENIVPTILSKNVNARHQEKAKESARQQLYPIFVVATKKRQSNVRVNSCTSFYTTLYQTCTHTILSKSYTPWIQSTLVYQKLNQAPNMVYQLVCQVLNQAPNAVYQLMCQVLNQALYQY